MTCSVIYLPVRRRRPREGCSGRPVWTGSAAVSRRPRTDMPCVTRLPRRAAIVFRCPCTETPPTAHLFRSVGHRSCLRIHHAGRGREAAERGARRRRASRRKRNGVGSTSPCAARLCSCASTPYVRLAIRCRGVHFPRLFGSCRHVPRLVMAGPLRRT